MKKSIGFLISVMSLILVSSFAVADPAKPIDRTLIHQQQTRHYMVAIDRATPGPKPLIILLHGGTQSAAKVWKQTNLPALANKAGMVLAAPDAVDGNWNDGRQTYFGTNNTPIGIDDVGFILAMIDDLAARQEIDPRRVFITGASNGGMMTYRMVCERADRFAAAGAVIATMMTQHDCRPSRPVPIVMILGTADPLVNWEGKSVTLGGKTSEPRFSGPQTADFWASINHCQIPGQSKMLDDRDPKDQSTVEQTTFQQCAATTIFYTIHGGGHTWPKIGSQRYSRLIQSYFGPINHDIDTGQVLIDFFRRH
jgi:polyhydroxybutyrate depolymerase